MEHERARVVRQRLEPLRPRPARAGKKALECEPLHRQSGDRQRAQKRARPGNRHHPHPRLHRAAHEHVSRIADERRARVAHEGERRPGEDAGQDLRRAAAFIVIVEGFEAGADAVVGEESSAMPGILGDDDVDLAEHHPRPFPEIGKVPYGGGDDIERTGAARRPFVLRSVALLRRGGAR